MAIGNSFIKYIVDNEYINFAESGSSILALREAVKPMASQVTRLHISSLKILLLFNGSHS
jgi:hypothetical protein